MAAAKNANTTGYTVTQNQMAQIIGSSNRVAQFLDRDTRPDFALGMQGLLKDFIASPAQDLPSYVAGITLALTFFPALLLGPVVQSLSTRLF